MYRRIDEIGKLLVDEKRGLKKGDTTAGIDVTQATLDKDNIALPGAVHLRDLELDEGVCLGATLDLAAKKVSGSATNKTTVQPTRRARFIEATHLLLTQMPVPQLLKNEIAALKKHPGTAFEKCRLANQLLIKFEKIEGRINDDRKKLETLLIKYEAAGAKDPNHPEFQKMLTYFMSMVNRREKKVHMQANTLLDDIILKRLGIFVRKLMSGQEEDMIPTEQFLASLPKHLKKIDMTQGSHVLVAMEPKGKRQEGHVIYCSWQPPYDIQDANIPGFTGFQTNDFDEFRLYIALWATYYPELNHVSQIMHVTKR
ncbi:MAG TPA: hypothetical protein VN457_00750 [Chlamydiales bacterium]|nr:hypothetical protein [Chlamydiales bacterium]